MLRYKALLQQIEDFIAQQGYEQGPNKLYEPIKYIMGLGGKRMRPVSVLLANEMFDGKLDTALPVAYAMELFHNFTLVHDDIMDEATMRRGKETVHQKYDVTTGILSGDVMLIYVYRYFEHLPPALFQEAIKLLNDTGIKVCEGQQYDIDFETQSAVSEGKYFTMIEYKTAVLLACCLQIGALIAGAEKKDAVSLYRFGIHTGTAFQLMDDWLDTFGDEAAFGKTIGGDILQGKQTYLLIKAKELANYEDKAFLNGYLNDNAYTDNEKVTQVTQIMRKYQVDEMARQLMESRHQQALQQLEGIAVSAEKKQPLIDMANQLLQRTV